MATLIYTVRQFAGWAIVIFGISLLPGVVVPERWSEALVFLVLSVAIFLLTLHPRLHAIVHNAGEDAQHTMLPKRYRP